MSEDNAVKTEFVVEIKISDIDSGDDLTNGILTIDGSRYLLSIIRKELKAI
jgi:hypothetical protein